MFMIVVGVLVLSSVQIDPQVKEIGKLLNINPNTPSFRRSIRKWNDPDTSTLEPYFCAMWHKASIMSGTKRGLWSSESQHPTSIREHGNATTAFVFADDSVPFVVKDFCKDLTALPPEIADYRSKFIAEVTLAQLGLGCPHVQQPVAICNHVKDPTVPSDVEVMTIVYPHAGMAASKHPKMKIDFSTPDLANAGACRVTAWLIQLVQGLHALLTKNILHCDLHTSNYLIRRDTATIIDLGDARQMFTTPCGNQAPIYGSLDGGDLRGLLVGFKALALGIKKEIGSCDVDQHGVDKVMAAKTPGDHWFGELIDACLALEKLTHGCLAEVQRDTGRRPCADHLARTYQAVANAVEMARFSNGCV